MLGNQSSLPWLIKTQPVSPTPITTAPATVAGKERNILFDKIPPETNPTTAEIVSRLLRVFALLELRVAATSMIPPWLISDAGLCV